MSVRPHPPRRTTLCRRDRATTLAETLVVMAVIIIAGSLVLGIASAVWNVVKSWK